MNTLILNTNDKDAAIKAINNWLLQAINERLEREILEGINNLNY